MRLDHRLQARLDPSDVIQEAYADVAAKLDEYSQLKQILGVRDFALERLLCAEGIAFP